MALWKKEKAESAAPPKRSAPRHHDSLDAVRLREPLPRAPLARLQYYMQLVPKNLGTVFGVGIFLLVAGVTWQYLYHSSYFHVKNWEVIGCERLKEEEVLNVLVKDWPEPDAIPLPQYDVKAAEAELINLPVVYHAFVMKHYPDGVQVVLQERRERALLVAANGNYLVDVEGVLMARSSAGDLLNGELPILTNASNWEVGDRLPPDFIDSALVYIETLSTADTVLAGQLSEINWSETHGISLFLTTGTRLICGKLPPHETLPRASALAQKLGGLEDVDYADLRLPNDLPWRPFKPQDEIARAR